MLALSRGRAEYNQGEVYMKAFKDQMRKINGDMSRGALSHSLSDRGDLVLGGSVQIIKWHGAVGASDSETVLQDDNLIVTMARKTMSRLVSGVVNSPTIETIGGPVLVTDASSLVISQMRWGTGGENPSTPTEAIAPLATDEALNEPLADPVFKPVTVDYPTDTSVRFTASLGQAEANGEGLSEEGLFSTDGYMFARKTFGILTKTSDFSFQFLHSILF